MRVSVHLRPTDNKTNIRALGLAQGLQDAGHKVTLTGRDDTLPADLHVQVGFALTGALCACMDRGEPFIIMEAPFLRGELGWDLYTASSFGYNGLAGGALRPEPPSEERWKPELRPLKGKEDGNILIIGQKPTDHSLRGSNHGYWLRTKLLEFPEAVFRPNPLMHPYNTLPPITVALAQAWKVISYTSTAGAEGLVMGCESLPDSRYSMAHAVTDRATWLHELSWCNFYHNEYATQRVVSHILTGYEEARHRASSLEYDRPRERVDPQAICAAYYEAING